LINPSLPPPYFLPLYISTAQVIFRGEVVPCPMNDDVKGNPVYLTVAVFLEFLRFINFCLSKKADFLIIVASEPLSLASITA